MPANLNVHNIYISFKFVSSVLSEHEEVTMLGYKSPLEPVLNNGYEKNIHYIIIQYANIVNIQM